MNFKTKGVYKMVIKKKANQIIITMAMAIILLFVGCTSNTGSTTDTGVSESVVNTNNTAVESTSNDSLSTSNGELPSNDMDPDYDTVFNQLEVMEINIVIDTEDWEAMQEDLSTSVSGGNGKQGNKQERGQGVQPGVEGTQERQERVQPGVEGTQERQERVQPEAEGTQANGEVLTARTDNIPVGEAVAEAKIPVDTTETVEESDNPIWVESSITVDGLTWDHVGIRFKGNSSLTSAVSSGNGKLSFKLDFDEFEDEYPEVEDQRFYGFKQLNLNNNYSDTSLMREKVAADLFNEFGVASAATSFVAVYVDHGEGSQYYGVYTLVEEIDDTGIESLFSDDSGNLYKPDGSGATFADGTYNESQMEKKSNEDENDYSDVKSLYEIMNSDIRETDIDSWKNQLEAIFNIDNYMKYLAANVVIQNWDTYGNMTHNYYLYNDPESGQLTWIPWDNNEAFGSGKGNRTALDLDLSKVSDSWPLISYLIDIPEYKALYDTYIQAFVDEVFTVDKMTESYESYYELIKDYAYAEEDGYSFLKSSDEFDQSVEALKTQVEARNKAVESYLE